MKHLSDSQIRRLEQELALREQELRGKIHEELARMHGETGAGVPREVGDGAAAGEAADLDAAIVDRNTHELAELDAARGRLRAGTYGVCIDCGEDIPWQRLIAAPAGTRCVPCAGQHDRGYASERTPSL